MLINVLCVNYDASGAVATLTVTDDNEIMNVTPKMVLDALLNGKMQSQTARVTILGLDVLVDGNLINIGISMDAATKKLVKQYLGLSEAPKARKSTYTKKEKGPSDKEIALQAEREAYRLKQQAWMEENKRKANEARANGLVNLSPDERKKRIQEHFKNKRNN